MKKKSLLLIINIVLCILFSFGRTADKMTIIKGKLKVKNLPAEITLNSVADGDVVLHSTVTVAKDSTFGFYFTPSNSGFYKIGDRMSPVRIYVSPGKQISILVTDDGMKNLNKSDKENKILEEWDGILRRLKAANNLKGVVTYKDIFPILPEIEQQKDAFIAKNLKTKNPQFDKLVKGMAAAEFEYELYHFLFMPRTMHPTWEEHPPVYKKVSSGVHFANTDVLKYDFGQNFIGSYLQYLWIPRRTDGTKINENTFVNLCLENIKNDTLKGWYLINTEIMRSRAYDQVYRDKYEKIKPYILSDSQKAKVKKFEGTIRSFGDGEAAINFSGTTPDGKKVSLSDFKGKVVLVDVWATWCGPCKKEIPALQKLEEEMKGTDVVFISYSVDEKKDIEKWKKMVEAEKLSGVQLVGDAAFKSSICVDYKINAIPRFMVFAKDGSIVSIDAPRPSNPELKKLLEKLLK